MAAQLDPEDLRAVIQAYHAQCAEIVSKYDGSIAQYLGDGIMVRFGYPRAHEDDAERSIRCGLDLIASVGRQNTPTGSKLQVRVGIASGVVIVGDQLGFEPTQERAAVGEAPNLAARMQGLARPGCLVIADDTKRLTGPLFDYCDVGRVTVKGYDEPKQAWQVLGPTQFAGKFDALHADDMSPLVGREEDLDLLLRRWERAKTVEGRLVLLSGEPGIGKSRLVAELRQRIANDTFTSLQYFCTPLHQSSVLYPIISQLTHAIGIEPTDDANAKWTKLDAMLARASTTSDDASLLADLLSIQTHNKPATLPIDPQQRKDRTLAALVRLLDGLAHKQPVLVIFEDVHWIDPTSRELLDLIISCVDRLRALLVVTHRPEFVPPWAGHSSASTLLLNRLHPVEGARLAHRMTGGDQLSDDVIADIVERTDGIPLFVEELTKSVIEAGAGASRQILGMVQQTSATVPPALHAPLMARIDNLGAARAIAQIGSALGREFDFRLISAVSGKEGPELKNGLERLVGAGILHQRGVPPQSNYQFKHALMQDAAYGMLLRGPRRDLHTRIANILKTQFSDTSNALPELLAQHYAKAGLFQLSANSWRQAGDNALSRSASAEATSLFTAAIDVLLQLPEDATRDDQELDLRLRLGGAMTGPKGAMSSDATEHFTKARVLAERLGDGVRLSRTLFAPWQFHHIRGNHKEALLAAKAFVDVAERQGDTFARAVAHQCVGGSSAFIGSVNPAIKHLEHSRALEPHDHATISSALYGYDQGIPVRSWLANIYIQIGQFDRANLMLRESLDRGGPQANALSKAHSLLNVCSATELLEDWAVLRSTAKKLLAISKERGLIAFEAMAKCHVGRSLTELGNAEEAASWIRDGIATLNKTHMKFMIPEYLRTLSIAYSRAGQPDAALDAIREAMKLRSNAPILLAKGMILLAKDHSTTTEAEEDIQKAISNYRERGIKFGELKAATALARLWLNRGQVEESKHLLSPIYNGFDEGFELPAMKAAKEILDGCDIRSNMRH